MKKLALFIAVAASLTAAGNLVTDVRGLVAQRDFAAAEKLIASERARNGVQVEIAEAMSWLGRGALAAKDYAAADKYADEARTLAIELLRTRKLDAERHLPLALGASIEVHAQAVAAQGQRSEAVEFLRAELVRWKQTSIVERIQKNVNLLSLEGKRAPALTATEWLGTKPAPPLRGHPVLMFLWAHWCPDCKAMASSLASLRTKYAPRGLIVVAPTRQYGYAAGGMETGPAAESRYIEQVWRQFYAPLAGVPVPVSSELFQAYGASTTPTIVLIDRMGVVRLYHPGAMNEAELTAKLTPLLAR